MSSHGYLNVCWSVAVLRAFPITTTIVVGVAIIVGVDAVNVVVVVVVVVDTVVELGSLRI